MPSLLAIAPHRGAAPTRTFPVMWGETTHGQLANGFFTGGGHQTYPEGLPELDTESAVPILTGPGTPVLSSFKTPPARPSGGFRGKIEQVGLGAAHGLVKETNGQIWVWGNNLFLDLGLGQLFSEASEPRYSALSFFNTAIPMRNTVLEETVAGLGTTITEIYQLGNGYALLANGRVLSWGGNNQGQSGNGWAEGETPGPQRFEFPEGAKGTEEFNTAQTEYTALSSAEKKAFQETQYEEKRYRPSRSPAYVQTAGPAGTPTVGVNVLEHVSFLAVGWGVTYYLRVNPSTKEQEIWYSGVSSQFGKRVYAEKDERQAKLPTGAGKKIVALAATRTYYMVLTEDGNVYVIGSNATGCLANGKSGETGGGELFNHVTLPAKATAISAGEFHALVLLENGKCMAWGDNRQGQVGNNVDLRKAPHNEVVTAPAYVVDSETGVELANVVEIEAIGEPAAGGQIGGDWNLVRLSDGTVRVWGAGGSGQMANLTREDSPVAIQPGKASFPEGLTLNEAPTHVLKVAAASSKGMVIREKGVVPEPSLQGKPIVNGITVDWTLPEWVTGPWLPTKWQVKYRPVGTGAFTTSPVLAAATRSYTINGLTPGSAYEVQVAATSPAMKYKLESKTILGSGQIRIKLKPLEAGQREEHGWTFVYRRKQTFTQLPTRTEAETQFGKSEPAHGVVEQEPWLEAREITEGRTGILYLVAYVETVSRIYKEEKLSKAFIEELEALPNITLVEVAGTAPKRVVTITKTDTLEGEEVELEEVEGKNPNQVVGTWPGVYGTRLLEAVIAG